MYERNGTLIRQKYREYLLPLLLTAFSFSVGSVLQDVMIGHFLEDSALSAVGLASPAIIFLDMLSLMFSFGGVSCATAWMGRLDRRRTRLSFTLATGTAVMLSLLFCLAGSAHLASIADLLADGDRHVAQLAEQYLRPLLASGPFMVFACSVVMFISADGRPRYTCAVIVGSNALQLLLTYIFVQPMDLGIRGAGLAMLLSNVAACIMTVPYFCRKRSSFRFALPSLRDFGLMKGILAFGFGVGWMHVCRLIGTALLITILMTFAGADSLIIMVVCTNIAVVVDIIIDATTDTLLPIASSLFGEKDYYGIRQLVKSSLKTLLIISSALALLFLLLPGYAGVIFGVQSPDTMQKLIPAVRLYALSLPLYAMSSFLQHYYNLIRQKRLSWLLTLLKSLLFLLPAALLLVQLSSGLVWLSFALSEALSLLIVILLGQHVKKKTMLQGMLLPADNLAAHRLSFTIAADPKAAKELVDRILAFGQKLQHDRRLINLVAVAAEEMTVATANFAFADTPDGLIDFFMYAADDQVIVRFRDNGEPFNPVEYAPPESSPYITDGVALLRKAADRVDYSRQLGFNTTTLTFSAAPLQTPPAEAPAHNPS